MPTPPDDEIVQNLPKGWFILYCPYLGCQTSLMWTNEVNQEYMYFDEWTPVLNWAMDNVEHKNHHIHRFHQPERTDA